MKIPENIISAINTLGGTIYEVGGAVRDSFLGISDHKDHDYLVTGIPIGDLISLLKPFGKVDQVGKSFGVIKLTVGKDTYDIALPRVEKSTGQRHRDFDVQTDHTLPVETDLARRDFTINAIAVKLLPGGESEIIDPFNGQQAIAEKRISVVFPEAFQEDPLRMMRAVQFAARFNFRVDDKTHQLMIQNAHLISHVSPERIFMEIEKLMTRSEFPADAFRLMHSTGLLYIMFCELANTVGVEQPNKWHELDVFNHIMAALNSVPSTKLHVRLAALFHDIGKPGTYTNDNGEVHFYGHDIEGARIAEVVLNRWKAPNDLIHKVVTLVRNHMFTAGFDFTPKATRRLIAKVGENLIYDLIDLRIGDRIASGKPLLAMGKIGNLKRLVEAELADPAFSIRNLNINGNQIMQELDIPPGPKVGEILQALLEQVMDDPSLNATNTLLNIAQNLV